MVIINRLAGVGWISGSCAASTEPFYAKHVPNEITFDCELCLASWPCAPVRKSLKEHLAEHKLGAEMTGWMMLAARALPDTAPGYLFDRFLAWTKPSSATQTQ